MPTEHSTRAPGIGPLRPIPTFVGFGLLISIGFVLLRADSHRVAVGFIVPIVLVGIADAALSARALRARAFRITPTRTVADSPEQLTFEALIEAGRADVVLQIAPLSLTDTQIDVVTLPSDGSPIEIHSAPGDPRSSLVLRYRLTAITFGIWSASRWYAVRVPGGLWRGVAANPRRIADPQTLDDVARLREYVPGDRPSRVSWPVTARTGQLHVRAPGVEYDEVVIAVDLGIVPADRAVLNAILGTAADVVAGFLDRGRTVRLITQSLPSSFHERELKLALSAPHLDPMLSVIRTATGFIFDGVETATVIDTSIVTRRDDLTRRLANAEPGPMSRSPHIEDIRIDSDGVRYLR